MDKTYSVKRTTSINNQETQYEFLVTITPYNKWEITVLGDPTYNGIYCGGIITQREIGFVASFDIYTGLKRNKGIGTLFIDIALDICHNYEKENHIPFICLKGRLSCADNPNNWKLSLPFYNNYTTYMNQECAYTNSLETIFFIQTDNSYIRVVDYEDMFKTTNKEGLIVYIKQEYSPYIQEILH